MKNLTYFFCGLNIYSRTIDQFAFGTKVTKNSLTISLTINLDGSIVNITSTSLRSDGIHEVIVNSGSFMELSVLKPKLALAKFNAIGVPILRSQMKTTFKIISIYLDGIYN